MTQADPEGGGEAMSAPPPPPGVLEAFFGSRAPLAVAFADHLSTSAVAQGLVGPREVPRVWTRHVLNCAAIAPLLPGRARVADVGSGAGLPGLVLAIARPDLSVTLVEPLLRRVAWLEEVVKDLDLTTVTVVRARAEELDRDWADVATARAVAPLAKLAAWCLPLVTPGGRMLAIKGRTAEDELRDAAAGLPALGASSWTVREVGGDLLEDPTTVVEVLKGKGTSKGKARTPTASRAHRRGR